MANKYEKQQLQRKIEGVNRFQERFTESDAKIRAKGREITCQFPQDLSAADFIGAAITVGNEIKSRREKLSAASITLSEWKSGWQKEIDEAAETVKEQSREKIITLPNGVEIDISNKND